MPKLTQRAITREFIDNLSNESLVPLDVAKHIVPLSTSSYGRMVQDGRLKSVKLGGRVLYRTSDLRALVNSGVA